MKTRILIALLMSAFVFPMAYGQKYHYGNAHRNGIAIGCRLGWGGAPNGVSVQLPSRKFILESFAGYSIKGYRNVEGTWTQKGSTMMGLSFQPILFGEYDDPACFYLNLALNARINNKKFTPVGEFEDRPAVTPDFRTGIGFQINAANSVNFFLEVNVSYVNSPNNTYDWRQESAAGMRIILGRKM